MNEDQLEEVRNSVLQNSSVTCAFCRNPFFGKKTLTFAGSEWYICPGCERTLSHRINKVVNKAKRKNKKKEKNRKNARISRKSRQINRKKKKV
jgi:transposase-like protein